LIASWDRGWCIRWWVDNVSLHGLHDFINLFGLYINQKVRIGRGSPIVLDGLAEYFVPILDHCDTIIVVLAPDFLLVVVDIHPIMATTSTSAVEESCVQPIWMFAHVHEGFLDLLCDSFRSSLEFWRNISVNNGEVFSCNQTVQFDPSILGQ